MKVLDSDHCIAILRGHLDLSRHAATDDQLAVTAISVGELVHGVHKSAAPERNLSRLDVLLAQLVVLPFSDPAARRFGFLKAQLERAGNRLDDADLQIGCTALAAGLPLLTHNRKHFERIPGLVLEDWLNSPDR